MRKYFAKVTDADQHSKMNENHVEIRNKPFATIEKGKEGVFQLYDQEQGVYYDIKAIGLGYEDFEDEEDYKNRLHEVIAEKMDEQNLEHNISA